MFCDTVCNGKFISFILICSKEVMYINVTGVPSARLLPVFLHIYCTLIILEQTVLLNIISLFSHE